MENECPTTEFVSRLVKLEERELNKERRVSKLEDDGIALNRLVIIAELHQKSLDSINEALLKISESNQMIAFEVQGLKNDVADVKKDVDKVTKKVENIESTDNVNVPETMKKVASWFFAAIVAGIAGYVLISLGLSN